MLVAVIKAGHSPITLIIDALFASLTPTISPKPPEVTATNVLYYILYHSSSISTLTHI